ncbi:hypothetical protein OsI_04290 [Oryza sativa Indica Group]|uniref:Uncharacterized protein n=1 Tax=Oryza sativa subsp. indica TaxID=39946 RepID=A2WWL2_ORYSI|nr:hypothetical protein OsI_04290 [Oryza sativa Indica Group]
MDAFFLLVLLLCTPKLSQATTVTWQLPNLPLGVPVLENRASKQWHIDSTKASILDWSCVHVYASGVEAINQFSASAGGEETRAQGGDLGMKRAGRNRAAKPRLSNAPRPRFSTLPRLDSTEERVTKFGHTRSRFVGQR